MSSEQIKKRITATMANKGPHEIYCERLISWPQLPGPFPPNIPADGEIEYLGFGAKGAVFYNGPINGPGRYQPAWLLAWDAPGLSTGPAPNKVYVKCGSKIEIDNLTEAEILKCLEESSDVSKDEDKFTRTFVDATIKGLTTVEEIVGQVTANFGAKKFP